MNLTMPYAANKNSLVKGMQESFPIRRRWIMEVFPTVADILDKYRHLMSYGGEMVSIFILYLKSLELDYHISSYVFSQACAGV